MRNKRTCGLVAMTSAQHAEGRQFNPGQVYMATQIASVKILFVGKQLRYVYLFILREAAECPIDIAKRHYLVKRHDYEDVLLAIAEIW